MSAGVGVGVNSAQGCAGGMMCGADGTHARFGKGTEGVAPETTGRGVRLCRSHRDRVFSSWISERLAHPRRVSMYQQVDACSVQSGATAATLSRGK